MPSVTPAAPATGRSAAKREAIMDAATALFLGAGYQAVSMDEVAAAAAVSKQTVYNQFADKQNLFTAIVRTVAGRSDSILEQMSDALAAADDVRSALTAMAERYVHAVLRPEVLQLRRLIVREQARFPDLAREYYELAPRRGIDLLARTLERFAARGELALPPSADLAAAQFAYLVLGIPQDKALFCPDDPFTDDALDDICERAVDVFLAAYSPRAAQQQEGTS
jgi:TetR/AcrR family transcriptional repressor of mexJK operon